MIKFTYGKHDGSTCIGLGISRGNVNKLIEGQPILVDLKELGVVVNDQILIFFGETEAALHEQMKPFITPETKLDIDPRSGTM